MGGCTALENGEIVTQIQFAAPGTVADAVKCLVEANGQAKILAGGTDLLVQLRSGQLDAAAIVDVKHIPELRSIATEDGGFRIGAAVSGAELGEHAEVVKAWPGVVEALELIGSAQIQSRASLGGNLCNGSPAADSVPAMIAAATTCAIAGPEGMRQAKVEDIITGPGQTSLAPGEFLVSLFLPARPPHSGDAYLRFIPRTEMDIAVVGAGVSITLNDDGVCSTARVSLGAVAARPLLVADGAAALIGTKVDDAALDNLDGAARAACAPIDDKRGTVEYRTKVAGVLATRAATIALERPESN